MDRSSKRSLLIIGAVFFGLYLLSNNVVSVWHPFSNFSNLAHIPWLKWLLLGTAIWLIVSLSSSRSTRRRYRSYYNNLYSDSVTNDKIDQLREELNELRRSRSSKSAGFSSTERDEYEKRFDGLTERIINLEKIVTDRRYRLNEEFDDLKDK